MSWWRDAISVIWIMGVSKPPESVQSVQQALTAFLEHLPSEKLTLALSGGMDSMVLMHALAKAGVHFQAVHVHHGLQRHGDAWVRHCEQMAKALGVPCQVRRVQVQVQGKGIEAAARTARYQALWEAVPEGGVLLTAHHQRDQAETLLLNLLRGSGVRGLQGMLPLSQCGDNWLGRPFLNVPYQHLKAYARFFDLQWVEDTSNRKGWFLRNRIRYVLLPALKRLQPAIESQLAKTAAHHQAAETLLGRYAMQHLSVVQGKGGLDTAALSQLDALDRHHVLRYWFRTQHQTPLTQSHLEALDALVFAQEDRMPEVKIGAHFARRFQGVLMYPTCAPQPWAACPWQQRHSLPVQIEGSLTQAEDVGLAPFGQTRLTIKPYKKQFQAAGIPPWQRPWWPVLIRAGKPAYILNVGPVDKSCKNAEYAALKAAFHC